MHYYRKAYQNIIWHNIFLHLTPDLIVYSCRNIYFNFRLAIPLYLCCLICVQLYIAKVYNRNIDCSLAHHHSSPTHRPHVRVYVPYIRKQCTCISYMFCDHTHYIASQPFPIIIVYRFNYMLAQARPVGLRLRAHCIDMYAEVLRTSAQNESTTLPPRALIAERMMTQSAQTSTRRETLEWVALTTADGI